MESSTFQASVCSQLIDPFNEKCRGKLRESCRWKPESLFRWGGHGPALAPASLGLPRARVRGVHPLAKSALTRPERQMGRPARIGSQTLLARTVSAAKRPFKVAPGGPECGSQSAPCNSSSRSDALFRLCGCSDTHTDYVCVCMFEYMLICL